MRSPAPLPPHLDTLTVLSPPLLPRGPPYLQAGCVRPGERTEGRWVEEEESGWEDWWCWGCEDEQASAYFPWSDAR